MPSRKVPVNSHLLSIATCSGDSLAFFVRCSLPRSQIGILCPTCGTFAWPNLRRNAIRLLYDTAIPFRKEPIEADLVQLRIWVADNPFSFAEIADPKSQRPDLSGTSNAMLLFECLQFPASLFPNALKRIPVEPRSFSSFRCHAVVSSSCFVGRRPTVQCRSFGLSNGTLQWPVFSLKALAGIAIKPASFIPIKIPNYPSQESAHSERLQTLSNAEPPIGQLA